jgi:hypothetical protein
MACSGKHREEVIEINRCVTCNGSSPSSSTAFVFPVKKAKVNIETNKGKVHRTTCHEGPEDE